MKRIEYHNQVAERFNILRTRILSAAQLNMYDIHIHCENFYLQILNLIYDWNLVNLNVSSRNAPGIDLIDYKNEIIIQVSATCTKEKIDSSLQKIDSDKYRDFCFKFISISENAEKLKCKSYTLIEDIHFDPISDILDIDTLLKQISTSNIDKLKDIYNLVSKELDPIIHITNQSGIDNGKSLKSKLSQTWFKQKVIENVKNIGERYSEALDVEFSISNIIDSIEQNEHFLNRFKNEFEKLNKSFNIISCSSALVDDVNYIKEYILDIKSLVNDIINDKKNITEINHILSKCENISHELNMKMEKDGDFSSNLSYRIFNEQLSEYISYIKSDLVKVSINPYVLISGNAGVGKSHFIAHHALKRANEGKISLLLLGQLFHDTSHPFTQMKKQLGLCDAIEMDEIFEIMNNFGMEKNEKSIIFIDALNEGNGLNLWTDYLNGIVNHLKPYSQISLILSVRDTYNEQVLPTNFTEKNSIIKLELDGFSDVDNAIQEFLEYYKVPYSINESLRHQFRNPLFLKIYCMSYTENNTNQYGIDAILENYFTKLNRDIRKLYPQMLFPKKINIVKFALDEYIDIIIEKNNRNLLYDEISLRMIKKFESYQIPFNVLDELIAEGLFICINYDKKSYIHLAYELFDNFLIAKRIVNDGLDRHKSCELLVKYIFSESNEYHELFRNDQGILEALAIILPDLDIAIKSDKCEIFYWPESFLTKSRVDYDDVYYKSMLWRQPERIKYIAHSFVINECFTYIDLHVGVFEKFCDTVLQVTVVKDHIYNAGFLYKFLNSFSLDFFNRHWTSYVSYRFHQNRIFKTLVKWVWNCGTNGLKEDYSTLEYLARTLVWFLASLNHEVRDVTLKALMRLYSANIDILIDNLVKFRHVKDMYILEALLAAAYGAILNTKEVSCLSKLGESINELFTQYPIDNIIIRSYLENIYSNLTFRKIKSDKVDFNKLPFKSRGYYLVNESQIDKIREGILSQNDYTKLERYYIDYDADKEELVYEHNRIIRNIERHIKSIEIKKGEIEDLYIGELIGQIPVEDRENFIRMVEKEIFDMGYNYLIFKDKDLHGNYHSNHLDSIILKYEWIAINKILDIYVNFKGLLLEAFKNNQIHFDGVWQIPFYRWIDPTMDFFSCFERKEIKEVVYDIKDVLNNFDSIFRSTNDDKTWIKLNDIVYLTSHNITVNSIGYIVNNFEIDSVIKRLKGLGANPSRKAFEDLYVRELYWSKAYKYIQDECKRESGLISGSEFISERYIWDISDGSMEGYFSFSTISKHLFEELELEMKSDVFELYKNSEIIVKSLFEANYEDILLIKEEYISYYLNKTHKSILWAFFEDKNDLKCILYDGNTFRVVE